MQINGWNALSSCIYNGHYELADHDIDDAVRQMIGDEWLNIYLTCSNI